MNKKGFTTIELIVSFIMVVIILSSLIGFTISYRNRVSNEEIKTKLIDYKNSITKMIYDEIINGNLVSINSCIGEIHCANFIDKEGNSHTLRIETITSNNKNRGSYINYDGTRYLLPDSDLNKTKTRLDDESEVEVYEEACNFTSFNLENYQNKIYNLKIKFKHFLLDEEYVISLTIN